MVAAVDVDPEEALPEKSPAECSWIQQITFSYGLPLMRVGASRPLEPQDIPALREADNAEALIQQVKISWKAERVRHPKPSLYRALLRAFARKTCLAIFWCFLESVVRIAQPVLLQQLLRAMSSSDPTLMYRFAGGLAVASFGQALIHHQQFFVTMTTGWNLRIAMTGLIHWKLLLLRSSSLSSSADCYNLIANDCQRFDLALPFLHFGWSSILDIFAVGALLILDVGLTATLGALAVVFTFTLMMGRFGHYMLKRRKITAGLTDERLRLTSEAIAAVLTLKIFCWEEALVKRIAEIRQREHASIFRRQVVIAATSTMYFTLSPISCLVLFLIFVVQGHHLSVPTVYAVLSLLLTLRISVGKSLAMFVKTVPELIVSVRRFEQFLMLPEAPAGRTSFEMRNHMGCSLELTNASFSWTDGTQALENLNCCVRQDELLVVSGPVGSGKSAFLKGLLGDLDRSGLVQLPQRVAYAPQTPWIFAGTIRSNIILGSAFEEAWYEKVINACCLDKDLQQLESGDLTEIGGRGVNLSGGQRARVGLARAVYAKTQLILLDDPLAAVDPKVAAHLVQECICGVLKSTAVVLCTHHESILPLANTILLLGERGTVRACGPPSFVLDAIDGMQLSRHVPDVEAASEEPQMTQNAAVVKAATSLVKTEDDKQGSVSLSSYLHFAKLAGCPLSMCTLAAFFLSQVALLFANFWLGVWSKAEDQGRAFYIIIYVAATGTCVIFASLRSILFYSGSLRASSSLHGHALAAVLRTHLGFFTANPHGRIMNRFSGDLGNVDDLLSASMHEVADLGCIGAGAVLLLSITVPPLIPVFLVIFYYMLRLRRFVVKSMTQLKRADSMSRSPIFDCFADAMCGLTCLRAFGGQASSHERMVGLLQKNSKAWFWWLITNRFIGFRLDMVCVMIVALAAFGGAGLVQASLVSPNLVGLAIVEAISLSGLFQFVVRQSALVESFMTSFERLMTYSRLPPETDEGTSSAMSGRDFPVDGALAVSSLRLRYRADLPEVLKGVDFQCPGGIKVGICGRTGSGKSSFFMALSRLADITGSIAIDGVDITSVPLRDLRRCISWVPQEPSFFSGSLRFNLDPCGEYSDALILEALRSVKMSEALGSAGLDLETDSQGSNFSVGERQLLSLARALLQRRRILCMDEAFANVDFLTDRKVQAAILSMTKDLRATVLVIAHRMETLDDSDHIVVMDSGRVAEHGDPEELLDRPDGVYAGMIGRVTTKLTL